MWFFYDSRGNRAGLLSNDTVYYYIYDLQGDVIALARASTGEIVAGYSYDAWGNCTVTNAAGYTIGNRNPFRYRGYYYDNETGLYYLNSRYYSPEFGRFISADVYISTGQGLQGSNMFAYCGNDPVMYCDPNGDFSLCTMLNGATLLMIGVTACAVAAAAVTGGACVPLLIAATATFAAGGMTVLNGVAEVGESISGYNYMRDGLYNGNTEVYEAQRDIYATAADVGMTVVSTGIATGGICFVSGTLVQTEDGARPIEEIEQGDLVWSWNEETCETELKAVTEKYVSETSELIHIHVNGDEIVTTPGHPFYSPVLGWTAAIKLRAGDMLVLVNGEYVIVEKVQHEILETPEKVYNLNVKDCHTYYVTDDGVLVHNVCKRVGGGHGNKIHANRINSKLDELERSGYFDRLYGNRSLNTAGLNGTQRPDIIAFDLKGNAHFWEFASPSQASGRGVRILQRKIELIQQNNPGIIFHMVPW